jgi:hypothetical protein
MRFNSINRSYFKLNSRTPRAGGCDACLVRVKLRRTQPEQMSSGLPLKADIARCTRHVSKVPTTEVAALCLSERPNSELTLWRCYPIKWINVLKRCQNERSPNACDELSQLHRAGQLKRNARCGPDRSWDCVDRRAAEACPGPVTQITAQNKKPPEGGS